MRIGLLGTRGVPAHYGGFETAAEEIGQRLVRRGHDVVVYCRNPGQRVVEHLGMRLVNLPAVRVQAAETLSHTMLSAMHAVTVSRPDVALVFNAANAPFVAGLRRARVPVAVHVDGLEWQRSKWGNVASSYYRWAEARCAAWADAVIADSHGIAEHLRTTHGIRSWYLPYGAPIIAPDTSRLGEVGLAPRGYHLAVARFEPENHVREIVAGYVASTSRLPLVVVGDAPYAHEYKSAVLRAAAGDPRVRFLGSVWDSDLLDTLYAHALTYLHGHSVGGTNPSLLRAMGAGAPVVAYNVVFNREVVGPAGRWFSRPDEVARECEDAEANVEDAVVRGKQGQVDAATRYCWEDVADGYQALAEDLLRRRRDRR